jgi:hypothetical protein
MCLNCGCNEPDERHEDERNIIMQDLVEAGMANHMAVTDAWENMVATTEKVLNGSLKSTAWVGEAGEGGEPALSGAGGASAHPHKKRSQ